MRVFFHVQHLLGIGHLQRAATLARALRAAGFEVTLASGGMPVQGIEVLQLPAASSPDFRVLLDEHGRPVDEAWKRRRAAALLAAYRKTRPQILLIELFPFGRRQLRFELLPLLDEARRHKRPLVVCSVRDLLQPNPAKEDEALECFERYFDRLLVHADPRIVTLERSFAKAARLAGKLYYTGYVVEQGEDEGDAGAGEVLVSAGGGAVGRRLMETAMAARALSSLGSLTWRLFTRELAAREEQGLVIGPPRKDFRLRLRNCALSVSQAGYNTVAETLQARARALLVPFARGGEVEQTLRARLFAERGLVHLLEESELAPASLAAAVDRAAAAPRPSAAAVDLDGARASAELVRAWLA